MTNWKRPEAAASRRGWAAGWVGFVVLLMLGASVTAWTGQTRLRQFITARGDQLWEGQKVFRFVSFNIPNLLVVEDNMTFTEAQAWRLPDRFEINDALAAVQQAGGTVVRTYVVSVQRSKDDPAVPRHVLGPGRFNEAAFRTMDEVLQLAGQHGVRVIIPLVDNWSWWGGVADYAAFRGKQRDDFWTDPQLQEDFQTTVRFVLTRRNTRTGVAYRDDPALLGWEVGNELRAPADWIRRQAQFIKSLDARHLVIDGFQDTGLHEETLSAPEIDVVTTHHYPGAKKSFAELVRENAAKAAGRKPYFVGEFGFVGMPEKAAMLEAVVDSRVAGALLWSLRFRSRDGGFYWHSEPAGGNKYKAYHWPGFASGEGYDEAAMLALLQKQAFAIRGLALPKPSLPAAPVLLPVTSQGAALSWQGVAGATSYVVERASRRQGPWQVVAAAVDETAVQHRPLFVDESASLGTHFYRVKARNQAGLSKPSQAVGPVLVQERLWVDDMRDFSRVAQRQGELEIKTLECRRAREDAHRLSGKAGASIVYHLEGAIRSLRVDAFAVGESTEGLEFSVSEDGKHFTPLAVERTSFDHGPGDYQYWPAGRYQAPAISGNGRYVKMTFRDETQVGRVEMGWE